MDTERQDEALTNEAIDPAWWAHLATNESDADHAVVHWLTPVTDEEHATAPAVD